MDALISGRSGLALVIDEDKFFSIHVDDPDISVPRHPVDAHRILAEIPDLEEFVGIDRMKIVERLTLARRQADALFLLLSTIDTDPSIGEEVHKATAAALEQLLGEDVVRDYLENILSVRPLPEAIALDASLKLTEEIGTTRVNALLQKFDELQWIIQDAWEAWIGIPEEAFGDEGSEHYRQLWLKTAAQKGLFKSLITNRINRRNPKEFLLDAWGDQAIRSLPNRRAVIQSWAERLLDDPEMDEDVPLIAALEEPPRTPRSPRTERRSDGLRLPTSLLEELVWKSGPSFLLAQGRTLAFTDKKYDVFIDYASLDEGWVHTLADNLRKFGARVCIFLSASDAQSSLPGDVFYESLIQSSSGIIAVSTEDIDSGWARVELRNMYSCKRWDPTFRIVPMIVEYGREQLPFVESRVPCLDFRGTDPEVYQRSFLDLLRRLPTLKAKLAKRKEKEILKSISLPNQARVQSGAVLKEPAVLTQEKTFVDNILTAMNTQSILMLLAQADRNQRGVISNILHQSDRIYGKHNTLHITPPFSPKADLPRYFSQIGKQCDFEESTDSAAKWEDALDMRLSAGNIIFLLVSGFENGAEAPRRQLAGVLRSLSERHRGQFRMALCGGERLAELRYEAGKLSLLNVAKVFTWPELTAPDVLDWQEYYFPEAKLDLSTSKALLDLCGGHPRLIQYCLKQRQAQPERAIRTDRQDLLSYKFLWQLFVPYTFHENRRRQIYSWLQQENIAPAMSWPSDPLLRRLYWKNLLVQRGEHFQWRCDLVRHVGRETLAQKKR